MEKVKYIFNTDGLEIWSAFPTVESFRVFKKEKRNVSIANRFIELAYQAGLIKKKDNTDFEALLHRLSKLYANRRPSMEFSFETLIKEIKRETSIKQLVTQLKNLARQFRFEEPSEVLFTRLKKDFKIDSIKKHHALMLMAIWLGLQKKDLGLNSQSLLALPRKISPVPEMETEGVLAAFSFLGEYVNPYMIDFLKKELPVCCQDLKINYLNEKRLQFLATTCMGRFPVKTGVPGFPSTYGEAIKDALFLAYQLIISWELSPYYDSRVHFIIALETGRFESAESTIKELLQPDISPEYPVRLSHFAFIKAEQAEQKVSFIELKHPNVWAIEYFWSFPHLKGPSCLLSGQTAEEKGENLLPVTESSMKEFSEALVLGETKPFKILSIIRQYPPNTLTAQEVANIFTYRRLHHSAIRILSNILLSDPRNYVARSMRMSNFMFLGNYAKDPKTADLFYERGILDGEFVESSNPMDPVFYAEYSLIFWSKALKILKLIRNGAIQESIESRWVEIITNIKKAEHYATKGTIFRTFSDTRCTVYLMHYLGFRNLLEKKHNLLTKKNLPLVDTEGIYSETARSVLEMIGWLVFQNRSDSIEDSLTDRKRTLSLTNFLNSLSSPSFSICILVLVCTVLWDFSNPERQKQIIDRVLSLLTLAQEKAEELKKDCLGIYSFSPAFPVIQSPGEFSRWLMKTKHNLLRIKETGEYNTGLKLFLMQFDDEVISNPITLDLIQTEESA